MLESPGGHVAPRFSCGGTVPALKKLEGPMGVSGLQVRLGLQTHPPVEPWSLLSLYLLQCPVQVEGLALPVLGLQM